MSWKVSKSSRDEIYSNKCVKRYTRKRRKTAVRIGTTETLDGSECHRLQLEGLFSCKESNIVIPTHGRRNYCKY